jgi:hypothetical protein
LVVSRSSRARVGGTLRVIYDASLTQADNTANQSSLQASQNLCGTYTAKGYTDLNPGVQ